MSNRQEHQSEAPIQRKRKEAPSGREDGSTIIVAGNSDWNDDSDVKEIMGTQRGTGRTYQPQKAVEEGLSYTPPRDPPTVPSDNDLQGSEVAAGFAPSMEDTDPDVRILPDRIDGTDLEMQEDVALALRYNSETAHLTDVSVLVDGGVVKLYGTVSSEDDIGRVYTIVSALEGVIRVVSHLEIAD
jgi:hypothetical protein